MLRLGYICLCLFPALRFNLAGVDFIRVLSVLRSIYIMLLSVSRLVVMACVVLVSYVES